jgi:hypothetical protein
MDKLITLSAFILYGLGLLGIVAHAIKKWMMKEISYSIIDYLFFVDPRGSLLTLFSVLGAVLSAVGSGQINDPHLFPDASAAFLIGFAFDSTISPANSKQGMQS